MNDREKALWRALIQAEKRLDQAQPDVGMGPSAYELARRAWIRTKLPLDAEQFTQIVAIAEKL